MPPPQLTRPTAPQAQGPEIHQSDLPESSSNVSRDLGIGPSRRRQASVAPSATSNQTGISRTGTSALIQGASTAALSGPVRGRIPSRKSKLRRIRDLRKPSWLIMNAGLSGLPPMIAPTSSTAMAGDDSGMPPALATTSSAPPVSVTAPQAPDQPAVDFHALAASLVATIDDGPRKKSTTFLRRRGVRDPEGTGIWISKRAYRDRAGPTPPPRSRKRKKTEGVDGEDEHGENGEDQVDRENGEERVEEPSMTRVRRQVRGSAGIDGRVPVTRKRGQYGTKGKAGTTQDRRRTVKKPDRCDRKKEFTVPRIIPGMEGMRPGELLGDHVSEGLTMAALATVATQGMVSERGLKLSDHQRKEHARKKRDGILGAEKKWKMKQVQRRQLRKLRNQDRADRRRMFEERGLDPDDVSGDEDDSEEEFETQPDFLINLDREEDIRRGKESRPDPQNEEGEDEDDEGGEGSIGLELRARRDEDGDEEDGLGLDANVDRILRERAAEEENEHQNEDDDEEDEDEEETAEGEVRDGWIDAVLDEQLDEYRQRVANLRARNQSRLVGQGVIEEDEELRMINSGSFARRAPNENWSAEDTELFYKVSPMIKKIDHVLNPHTGAGGHWRTACVDDQVLPTSDSTSAQKQDAERAVAKSGSIQRGIEAEIKNRSGPRFLFTCQPNVI